MPLFFLDSSNISDSEVRIRGDIVKHLRGSLRYIEGDRIYVIDERRIRYKVEISKIERNEIKGTIINREVCEKGEEKEIVLGQGIIKGKRMDFVIQKAVELGISKIVPLITERTIVRPSEEKRPFQLKRWKTIAQEASQQSERWNIPVIEPHTDILSFFNRYQRDDYLYIILWEEESEQRLKDIVRQSVNKKGIICLVGSEGGFSYKEIVLAKEKGYISISLGDRILRTETASLAIISILQYELGDMG
ncbi:MAG: RsmE family RNA methyltransferase [Nitrospirota bacterium]